MNLNAIDPVYRLIRGFILKDFFKAKLAPEEQAFLLENTSKHRQVLWLTLIASVCVYVGLGKSSDTQSLINALIAPVMVTGGAWFSISFGGIPVRFMSVALRITFWMFTAFMISLSSMFIAIMSVSPLWIILPLIIIYVGVVVSCIVYDTADGMKVGLDDAVLKHSRAAIKFYQEQGITPDDEKHD